VKTLAAELRELWRAYAPALRVGTSPWEKALAAMAAASSGTCTPLLSLGLDARAIVRETPLVARLRFRVGPVVSLSARAEAPVPMTVIAARRSVLSRLTGGAPEAAVGDDAFDAAFTVRAPSSRVASSLLCAPLRAALLGLGSSVRLAYDAGDVTVRWRAPPEDTSSFDAGLDAVTLARAWRFQDGPYR
jgi:hypothetical protein